MSIQDMKDLKQHIEINQKKKLQQLSRLANLSTYPTRHFNSFCYDDDDDEEYTIAITPEKPVDFLIMEDEHLDTILETESDEFIKYNVENLVLTPSESEDFSDIESERDVPDCDDSQTTNFSTFSNSLFDDSTSSDDESSHEEIIHEMSFETYSSPLFDLDEEIISSEFNPIHNEDLDSTPKDVRFDAKSYLLESLVNLDTLMASPPKIDFLLDEFADELTHLQSIPPGIDNINLDPEGDILFLESLLYDNSSPQPLEAFQDNSNTIIESLPTFSIPVKEVTLLGKRSIYFPVRMTQYHRVLRVMISTRKMTIILLPFPSSIHFMLIIPIREIQPLMWWKRHPRDKKEIEEYEKQWKEKKERKEETGDVPNILPTHPALLMDFDFIPSHNDLGSDPDVSSPSGDRNKIYDPGICIEVESTRFLAPLSPVIDTLLPFSSKNEDKVFNHGVLSIREISSFFITSGLESFPAFS
ncbi:hypothetical protein Tco_0948344 [Tanacetum coccineum]